MTKERDQHISAIIREASVGLRTRMEVDALLKQAGVYLECTDEEFVQDIETSRQFSTNFQLTTRLEQSHKINRR